MKFPIYLSSILLISAGAALAAPPSKVHHPKNKNIHTTQQERMEMRQVRIDKQHARSSNRPATIALNMGENKEQGRKFTRNLSKSYHHRAR